MADANRRTPLEVWRGLSTLGKVAVGALVAFIAWVLIMIVLAQTTTVEFPGATAEANVAVVAGEPTLAQIEEFIRAANNLSENTEADGVYFPFGDGAGTGASYNTGCSTEGVAHACASASNPKHCFYSKLNLGVAKWYGKVAAGINTAPRTSWCSIGSSVVWRKTYYGENYVRVGFPASTSGMKYRYVQVAYSGCHYYNGITNHNCLVELQHRFQAGANVPVFGQIWVSGTSVFICNMQRIYPNDWTFRGQKWCPNLAASQMTLAKRDAVIRRQVIHPKSENAKRNLLVAVREESLGGRKLVLKSGKIVQVGKRH